MSSNKDKKPADQKGGKKGKWSRRAFIGLGGLAGLGLVVGVGGNIYLTRNANKFSGKGFNGKALNAWVHISPDNIVTLAMPRAEMGQGVSTSLPMLIAEELEVPMSDIQIVQPQPEAAYANTQLVTQKPRNIYSSMDFMEKIAHFLPVVATGGSTSIPDAYDVLRSMGASAREMLILAAAKKWGVKASDCYAENAHVVNKINKERLTYGTLAEAASEIELDEIPKLKEKADWKVLGKPIQRLDIPEKVNGSAEFGLDIRPDGMLYGVIRHATYHDGVVSSVKNLSKIEGMKGVKKVVMLPEGKGVVVVADNTWRAKNASLALELEETGDHTISSVDIDAQAQDVIDNKIIATPQNIGDASKILDESKGILTATYDVPYLAHACMEPINCTVLVKGDKAEIWAGHQGSSLLADGVKKIAGTKYENITTHMKYLGGGFGRRAEVDMIHYATHVAKEMEGTPIQLVFTREEDMRHDMYRPAAKSQFRAKVKDGKIEAWENKMGLQSVSNSSMLRVLPALAEGPEKDPATAEGAIHLPYEMENFKFAFGQVEVPIYVGYWRSVGSSHNGFFTESFIDECAHAVGKDPFEFRKDLIKDKRFKNVLEKVAEISNWKQPLGENRFRGIALCKSFGSIVGQVAEITKMEDKKIRIDNFYCVIDCGNIVNPDTIEAQMQSGIMFGLSAALYGEITFKDGEVEQYNFPQYEMVRMNIAPTVHVHIMDVDEYPGGVGEPATPPAAPALANAIFAATGERVRSLPLKKHGFSFV